MIIDDDAIKFAVSNKAVNVRKVLKEKIPCITNDKTEYIANIIKEAAQAPNISVA